MELKQQNDQIRMASMYPCPLCGIGGELTAKYDRVKDLVEYECRLCKGQFYNSQFYNVAII